MEFTFLIEAVKAVGYPALIFAIWWMTNKQSNRNIEDLINNFKKTNEEMLSEMKEMTDALQMNYSQLTRIELKIDQNQWCPMIRIKRPVIEEDDK